MGAKLHVFTLCDPKTSGIGPHTYVHAKTMMVDDEMALIGSANCNRRGWESDTEVAVAIAGGVTAGGVPPAKSLRRRLWAEHLGVGASVVDDARASAPLWWLPVGSAGSVTLPAGTTVPLPARRVLPYDVNAGTDGCADPGWDFFVDPPVPATGAPCGTMAIPARASIRPEPQLGAKNPVGVR